MEPDPDYAGGGKRAHTIQSVLTASIPAVVFSMTNNTKINNIINGLYLITDDSDVTTLLLRVSAALRGGAKIIQYRDKIRSNAEKVEIALQLRQLCRQQDALFIINDSIELAQQSRADGVHLGQNDASILTARKALGDSALIGISTRNVEMALLAEQQGADYIGVGSIYPTNTKDDAVHIGLDGLRQIRQAVKLPIVAIGGIDNNGLAAVIAAGADAAALVSAVMADPHPDIAARELTLQFKRNKALPHGRVLTIAGSDSSGGAGIQADIKTITLLGCYASSVITALTAQSTCGVSAIHAPPASFVAQQLQAVLEDIGTDTIKTGMLYSEEIIARVAATLQDEAALCVIDPVMIAKGGANLLQQSAIATFIEQLLPQAYLLTPNVPEAEALTANGNAIKTISNIHDMEQAALQLQQMGARNVLIKGGHLAGDPVDVLLYNNEFHHFSGKRIASQHTHGTGCTTAAAVATLLAQGVVLPEAVKLCKQFITQAIHAAPQLGKGHGPVNHYTAALTIVDQLHGRHSIK